MSHRTGLLLLALVLLTWWPATPARAQTCVLQSTSSPVLDFGAPPANPTAATSTSTTLRVFCSGSSANQQIKVCIKPTNGSPDSSLVPRRMANGSARLEYNLYDASNQPVGSGGGGLSPATGIVTLGGSPGYSGTADITLTGRLVAGQSGLAPGTYTSTMANSQVTYSTNTSQNCNAINTLAGSFTLTATAQIVGSCTIDAGDLDFGTRTSLAGTIDGSASIGLNCTSGTPYTVRLDGGLAGNVAARQMGLNGAPPGVIGYQLYRDSGRLEPWGDGTGGTLTRAGTGTGLPTTLTVYGRIPSQTTPLAGAYQDVVTATVEY